MPQLDLILLAGFILVVFYFLGKRRMRIRRAQATYRVAYAHFSSKALEADPDFIAQFGDSLPTSLEGLSLLRVSLRNTGDREVPKDHFKGPIEIVLPHSTRVLEVTLADTRRLSADAELPAVHSKMNRVVVEPFELPERVSIILNCILDGDAEPLDVRGQFIRQETIAPLMEGVRT